MDMIDKANIIIEDFTAQGFKLTLRQLYYQFVTRNWIPNKQSEYKRLGSIIDEGRQAGLIDWDAIEDRTRNLEKLPYWSGPQDILYAVWNQYREDLWKAQDYFPEVWIEKDALTGVIANVCERWRVPYFACRGYTSQSEMYSAAKRFEDASNSGRTPIVLHLGDHDPSGIDMSRDNQDRLELFSNYAGVELRRLALNMDQIDQYNPPPNPAKKTDIRFEKYAELHGESSWELDALNPAVIENLIGDEIQTLIDDVLWSESSDHEQENKRLLGETYRRWDGVKNWLTSTGEAL
jgi:hypothetical protein